MGGRAVPPFTVIKKSVENWPKTVFLGKKNLFLVPIFSNSGTGSFKLSIGTHYCQLVTDFYCVFLLCNENNEPFTS